MTIRNDHHRYFLDQGEPESGEAKAVCIDNIERDAAFQLAMTRAGYRPHTVTAPGTEHPSYTPARGMPVTTRSAMADL
jgi:hypothetical protein